MNNNITQEEKIAYNTFLNELEKLLITFGGVTSSKLGDILSMPNTNYIHLGNYFKKLGYFEVAISTKEGIDQGSASPLYKYVLATAITFLVIPTSTSLVASTIGAYFMSEVAETLWDAYVDLGEWLAENKNNEDEAIRNLLANKDIIIIDGCISSSISIFQNYDIFCSYNDLIEILKDKTETASETRSPLAIDLDGDGVETVSADNGVYFDHDGNGFAEKTGWIGKDDGILVRDLNNNGQIDNGSELFGDQTVLSNGKKAANGFEALADLDSNQDGVFDGDDDAFGEVMVWQDLNQNGVANLCSRTDYRHN